MQLGDVFNRQDGGRACFELLLRLRDEAPTSGGEVTVLAGNHDVMTADGIEAYCTLGEYLSFAPSRQRAAFPERVDRAIRRLFERGSHEEIVPPLGPRVEAWAVENVPGRRELRRAFGPRGRVGRALRRLPVVVRVGELALVHGGLAPRWSRVGIEGLNQSAADGWAARDGGDRDSFYKSAIGDQAGPLWHRRFAEDKGRPVERSLTATLSHLGTRRLVIGHTQTRFLRGGEAGRILTRFDDRVVCIDVGMRDHDPATWAALVVERGQGWEWKPSGRRRLW